MICGALCAVRSVLYYFGLVLCGPSRTLLLADYTPSSLVVVLTTLFLNNKNPVPAARFRGNVMCVIAIVILWLWEDPEAVHTVDHVDSKMVVHQVPFAPLARQPDNARFSAAFTSQPS